MIERDYHGWLAEDALKDIDKIIGQVRLSGAQEQAEFVTGFGKIQHQVFEALESYSLEPEYKTSNQGSILVVID